MAKTLRDWIDDLEKNNLLHRVKEEVPIEQLASTVYENTRKATLFENIAGYEMPLIANTFSNREMMQLALGCDEANYMQTLNDCRERLIKPVEVESAPCHEVVKTGDEVNLADFPLHVQHALDGAPYINATIAIAKDPLRGVYNMGVYRYMYRTRNTTGIDVTAPHKMKYYYEQAIKLGKPLEMAIALGMPTIDLLAAVASSPYDVDEYEVLGGFRNEPVELVKCKTIDLLVPANAEIILECVMEPDGWIADEGPYGEFTGTYAGGLKRNPIVKVKAITHRKNPIFHSATHGGDHIGWTDVHLIFPIIELDMYRALREAGIDVQAVRVFPASGCNWGVASIRPLSMGDGKQAALAMLTSTRHGLPKFSVVVDEDVNIFDDEQVIWAMTWRTRAEKDIQILDHMKAIPLDPSLDSSQPPVEGGKMAWDATIPVNRDKADFLRCSATPYDPDVPKKHSPCSDEELEEKILKFIGDKGACFFNEVMMEFYGLGHKTLLEAFGRLREKNVLARQNDGQYILASDSK